MRVCCLFPSGPAAGKKSCTFITPHEAGNVREGIGRGVQVKYRGGGGAVACCYLHHVLTTMYISTCGRPNPTEEANLQL